MRLPLAVIDAVRREMPDGMPLLMRISATDWHDVEGDLQRSIEFISSKSAASTWSTCLAVATVVRLQSVRAPGIRRNWLRAFAPQWIYP